MTNYNILITDGLDERGQSILRASASVNYRESTPADELASLIADQDALIVRGQTRVTAAVMDARCTRSDAGAGHDIVVAALDGSVVARMTGIVTAPADQVLAGAQPETWLHHLVWEPASVQAPPAAQPAAASAW